MKIKWLPATALLATLSLPAFGQIQVYIGRTPPPIRYEVRPPVPGEGFQWIDGYWGISNNRYVWVTGRWERPPYAGAYWSHPHYDHYQQGWQMHEGHWDREDHHDHHDDDRHDNGHDNRR
jgi:hypothetical protein